MFDDPLYLSTSDQPLLQLVAHQFNGDNFVHWKRDVYFALVSKNKEGFVDGTCKWILNSLEKGIRESLKYVSSSKELWTEIIDRYGQANTLEIYQLKISSITQENSSLVDYYSRLKRTWETIDTLDLLPLCEVNAKLIQFLMGLSDDYESVKTRVLTLEPLPPLNKAFALLQKIEKQKQLHVQTEILSDASAFNSFKGTDNTSWKKPRKQCHYCHHFGHIKSECFKLKECGHCGRKGHAHENCFSLRGGSARGVRGRGRASPSTGARFGTGSGNYKREAHHADVLPTADSDLCIDDDHLIDPLTDISSSRAQCSLQVQHN
ncbi:hypothetical protein RND81_07G136400 [Saponaria officinalis]|uniref:Retrotransposon Copia-like N-terminal domain-containing protein n=1 Tax=Saponaria officinalis TaxID=3572 RepID=A0AAW1JR38_SAPOF